MFRFVEIAFCALHTKLHASRLALCEGSNAILIKNLALCMCSTMGSNTITLLESLTPICLFSRQLLRVMMTVTS